MSEKVKDSSQNNAHHVESSEMERLRRDIFRPDIEKLSLFTRMLKQNALLKKAKISHK